MEMDTSEVLRGLKAPHPLPEMHEPVDYNRLERNNYLPSVIWRADDPHRRLNSAARKRSS